MTPVANVISRRKHNKPPVNAKIAALNNTEMTRDKFNPSSAPKNSVTIDMQTNKAHTVHALIAQ